MMHDVCYEIHVYDFQTIDQTRSFMVKKILVFIHLLYRWAMGK